MKMCRFEYLVLCTCSARNNPGVLDGPANSSPKTLEPPCFRCLPVRPGEPRIVPGQTSILRKARMRRDTIIRHAVTAAIIRAAYSSSSTSTCHGPCGGATSAQVRQGRYRRVAMCSGGLTGCGLNIDLSAALSATALFVTALFFFC